MVISAEGVHTLLYRSTDRADQVEATNSVTIRIDRSPPEAYLQFDPVGHDIQLFGRDALSGQASSGPITPISVVLVGGEDRGQHGVKTNDRKSYGSNQRNDDHSKDESRTYLVKDLADNTLQLVIHLRQEDHQINATVVSLQYNGGKVISPLQAVLSWDWDVAKNGSLKELEQHIKVVDGSSTFSVEAHYSARKNATLIERERSQSKNNVTNKNQERHDAGEHSDALTLPGLVLLRLTSSQGHLVIVIPGLSNE